MSGSVNKAIIVGNLGTDPEVRDLPSGQRVANLRVATSDSWVDKATGERRERTEWHNVTVFDQNAVSFAQKFLRKGDRVYAEGRLQTRSWQDQNGLDRYTTEVVVNAVGGQLAGLSSRDEGNGAVAAQPKERTQSPLDDWEPPF